MKFAPGLPVPRSEDKRFLTGKGRYGDDITHPGQTYMAVVRSPHAHAAILGIDTETASRAPGVLCVLTAQDWEADGLGQLYAPGFPQRIPLRTPAGVPYVNPGRRTLASGKVVFVGEAVAVVVAETAAQAVDAVEMVTVEYDPLPAVADTEAASAADAPLVRDDLPRNTVFVHEFGDPVATEAAFRGAPHVARKRLVSNRVHANPMETRSVNALFDEERRSFTIWTGVHRPFELRDMLAEKVFHVGRDKVDIVTGDIGGSFGLKGTYPVETALVPWAARRLRRPVKWTATRSEMMIADNHGRDVVTDAEIAFDGNGKILAVRCSNTNNLGAHIEFLGAAPALINVGGTVGPYTIPAAHVRAKGVLSHTSPTTAYRGAGRPEASYIIERLMDLVAAELGLDPVEVRRRNLIPKEAMPYKTALTFTYDCGEFEAVLDKAVAAADYAGFEDRRATSASRGMLRGIGVSMSIESAGGQGKEFAELKFDAGGKATVLGGSTNWGMGHETTFLQFVSGRLGIAPEDIEVIESDTRVVRWGAGTGGSRSGAFNAAAIGKAIENCIDAGRPVAARLLQADEAKLSFESGRYGVEGDNRNVSFAEVVRASFEDGGEGLSGLGEIELEKPAFPNGCQICEVEVDPRTGRIEICRHTVCDDVGFEVNPLIVRGQLVGGIAQGLGQALMEHMVMDGDGQVLTGSFMDYAMPRATDFGRVELLSHPVPTATNPFGIKGVGEAGTVGALPAVMNAVNNALSSAGAPHVEMPATPHRVWHAIRGAQRA